jgi:hypothetical protein
MIFKCVNARFYFWNGQQGYTVDFEYGLMKWYVFRDHEQFNAIYTKKVKGKSKTTIREEAESILEEYLESID